MAETKPNSASVLDRLMLLCEVAKTIGQSEREVWREVSRGRLARPVRGRPARWFESDVRKYLQLLRDERDKMDVVENRVVA